MTALPNPDALAAELRTSIDRITKDTARDQIQMALLLKRSQAAGGPDSIGGAFQIKMEALNIGLRSLVTQVNRKLSGKSGVSRNQLQKMLDGRKDFPPDILVAVSEILEKPVVNPATNTVVEL